VVSSCLFARERERERERARGEEEMCLPVAAMASEAPPAGLLGQWHRVSCNCVDDELSSALCMRPV